MQIAEDSHQQIQPNKIIIIISDDEDGDGTKFDDGILKLHLLSYSSTPEAYHYPVLSVQMGGALVTHKLGGSE